MDCLVLGWRVMASAMDSSGSDVHPDASLSAVNENSAHKADAESRCVFINYVLSCYHSFC